MSYDDLILDGRVLPFSYRIFVRAIVRSAVLAGHTNRSGEQRKTAYRIYELRRCPNGREYAF